MSLILITFGAILLLLKFYRPALDWRARRHNRNFQWVNYYKGH